MNLPEAIEYLRNVDPSLAKTKKALPLVCDAAERTLPSSHEHLIWRNPFDNIKQFPHPGEKTAQVPNPNPVKTPAPSSLSGEQR